MKILPATAAERLISYHMAVTGPRYRISENDLHRANIITRGSLVAQETTIIDIRLKMRKDPYMIADIRFTHTQSSHNVRTIKSKCSPRCLRKEKPITGKLLA